MRKNAIILIAIALGAILLSLLPTTAVQASGDDPNGFQMPYPNYFIAGDCHADGWGAWCALDPNSIPDSGPLFSPITGEVIAKGENDGFGNTYICIQNSRWEVCMLHGIYNINLGDWVVIGQRLGEEASIGNSTGPHTHLSLYDRTTASWIDPRTALGSNVGFTTASNDQSQDSSPHPQPGPVDWNFIGVSAPGQFIPAATTQANSTQATTTEYWQKTYIQDENPIRLYLLEIHWAWFAVMSLCLILLASNSHSKHWWPFWFALLGLVITGFIWSRQAKPATRNQTTVAITATANPKELIVFTDPDKPLQLPVLPDPPPPHRGFSEQSGSNPDSPSPAGNGILGGFPDRTRYANPPEGAIPITIFVSYYVPLWDGEKHGGDGPNCGSYSMGPLPDYAANYPYAEKRLGWCISRMSSGKMWEEYMGYAVACPDDLDFGTKIYAFGREWMCLDRGGLIYKEGETYRIDFLTPNSPAPFASQHQAYMVKP